MSNIPNNLSSNNFKTCLQKWITELLQVKTGCILLSKLFSVNNHVYICKFRITKLRQNKLKEKTPSPFFPLKTKTGSPALWNGHLGIQKRDRALGWDLCDRRASQQTGTTASGTFRGQTRNMPQAKRSPDLCGKSVAYVNELTFIIRNVNDLRPV